MKRPNILIKLLAVVIMAIIIGLFIHKLTGGDESQTVTTNKTNATKKPIAGSKHVDPDGDTNSEDIRKLAAGVQQLKDTVGGLKEKIEVLKAENKGKAAATLALKGRVESLLDGGNEPNAPKKPNKDSTKDETASTSTPKKTLFGDINQKLDGIVPPVRTSQKEESISTDSNPERIVWIQSADSSYDATIGKNIKKPVSTDRASNGDSGSGQNTRGLFNEAKSKAADTVGLDLQKIPRYTIPDQSIIANATNITALIGRIPIQGQVQDAWHFKIATGRKIIMPNGHYLDGLQKTFIEGIAQGDLNLRCVTGKIQKMTFIFDDGTIVTKMADNKKEGMGYITDDHATPCIPGELITNAPQAIAQLGGLGAVTGTLQSIAANQKTVQSNTNGTATSFVTGDQLTANAASGLSQGGQEIMKWLTDRLNQFFDVIYVPAGKHLDVHIEQQIKIDYDPMGRKIKYANSSGSMSGGMD